MMGSIGLKNNMLKEHSVSFAPVDLKKFLIYDDRHTENDKGRKVMA